MPECNLMSENRDSDFFSLKMCIESAQTKNKDAVSADFIYKTCSNDLF